MRSADMAKGDAQREKAVLEVVRILEEHLDSLPADEAEERIHDLEAAVEKIFVRKLNWAKAHARRKR